MNNHVLIGVIMSLAGTAAGASFTYTFQGRTIGADASAMMGAVTDHQTAVAPGFGYWNQSVEAQAWDTTYGVYGWGNARQESRLDPQQIMIDGYWSGGRTGQGCGGGGSSSASVTFTLDERSGYAMSVSWANDWFYLSGPDDFVISGAAGEFTGTLAPGEYSLSVGCAGGASYPPSGGGAHAVLTLTALQPCPADFNHDGVVSTPDLIVLLGSFGSQVASGQGADYNGSGTVDTADLIQLLYAFGTTCE